MSTEHTPGRLYVVEGDDYSGRINYHISAEHDDAMLGSIWCASASQNREDARRLAACWNACDGLPTEKLEISPIFDVAMEANRHLASVEKQRDELLEALKLAEAALSDIGDADREPGDDVAWCEARAAEAIPTVRAAIAKAEGGAA